MQQINNTTYQSTDLGDVKPVVTIGGVVDKFIPKEISEGMLRIDMPEDFMRSAIYGLIYRDQIKRNNI